MEPAGDPPSQQSDNAASQCAFGLVRISESTNQIVLDPEENLRNKGFKTPHIYRTTSGWYMIVHRRHFSRLQTIQIPDLVIDPICHPSSSNLGIRDPCDILQAAADAVINGSQHATQYYQAIAEANGLEEDLDKLVHTHRQTTMEYLKDMRKHMGCITTSLKEAEMCLHNPDHEAVSTFESTIACLRSTISEIYNRTLQWVNANLHLLGEGPEVYADAILDCWGHIEGFLYQCKMARNAGDGPLSPRQADALRYLYTLIKDSRMGLDESVRDLEAALDHCHSGLGRPGQKLFATQILVRIPSLFLGGLLLTSFADSATHCPSKPIHFERLALQDRRDGPQRSGDILK